ncbi:MAG: hypothetical protein K0U29_08025 [Gammaproteobacteria bacterium]|nr:hypothetical protein [Gammaproteobacteria bacterium]
MSRLQHDRFFDPLLRWHEQSELEDVTQLSNFLNAVLQLCFKPKEIDPSTGDPFLEMEVFRQYAKQYTAQLTLTEQNQLFKISAAVYNCLQDIITPQTDSRGVPVGNTPGEQVKHMARCVSDAANDEHDPVDDFTSSGSAPGTYRKRARSRVMRRSLSNHLEQAGDSAYYKFSGFFDQVCNMLRPGVPIPDNLRLDHSKSRHFKSAAEQVVMPAVLTATWHERTVHSDYVVVYEFISLVVSCHEELQQESFKAVLERRPENYPELLTRKESLPECFHADLIRNFKSILQGQNFVGICCNYVGNVYDIQISKNDAIRKYIETLCAAILSSIEKYEQGMSGGDLERVSLGAELYGEELQGILLKVMAGNVKDKGLIPEDPPFSMSDLVGKVFGGSRSGTPDADMVQGKKPRRWDRLRRRWNRLSWKWKLAVAVGLVVGVGIIVACAVAAPPSLAITLPVAGKVTGVAAGGAIGGMVGGPIVLGSTAVFAYQLSRNPEAENTVGARSKAHNRRFEKRKPISTANAIEPDTGMLLRMIDNSGKKAPRGRSKSVPAFDATKFERLQKKREEDRAKAASSGDSASDRGSSGEDRDDAEAAAASAPGTPPVGHGRSSPRLMSEPSGGGEPASVGDAAAEKNVSGFLGHSRML